MIVYLTADGSEQIRGDYIGRCVLRSDLVPVPRSLEVTLNNKDDLAERVKTGSSLWAGHEMLEYEVVSSKVIKSPNVQGGDQLGKIQVSALLKSCIGVTYVRERAVVLEGATMAEIYRACGATAAFAEDITISRFVCLRGQVPTFHIARALQEEGAAIVLRDGRLSVKRLQDLMAQKPLETVGQTDSADAQESAFIERHSIPAFVSVDDDGNVILGDMNNARNVQYMPRASERTLRNASKVLVTRRVFEGDIAQHLNAGDVLNLNDQTMLVITVAHATQAKDALTMDSSKFWMGTLA